MPGYYFCLRYSSFCYLSEFITSFTFAKNCFLPSCGIRACSSYHFFSAIISGLVGIFLGSLFLYKSSGGGISGIFSFLAGSASYTGGVVCLASSIFGASTFGSSTFFGS